MDCHVGKGIANSIHQAYYDSNSICPGNKSIKEIWGTHPGPAESSWDYGFKTVFWQQPAMEWVFSCCIWLLKFHHSRLADQISTGLSQLQGKYETLTQSLSEATVAPESVTSPLECHYARCLVVVRIQHWQLPHIHQFQPIIGQSGMRSRKTLWLSPSLMYRWTRCLFVGSPLARINSWKHMMQKNILHVSPLLFPNVFTQTVAQGHEDW